MRIIWRRHYTSCDIETQKKAQGIKLRQIMLHVEKEMTPNLVSHVPAPQFPDSSASQMSRQTMQRQQMQQLQRFKLLSTDCENHADKKKIRESWK